MVFSGWKKHNNLIKKIYEISTSILLGVQLENKLLWKNPIGAVCMKITTSLGIIARIKDYVHVSVILSLYYS